MAVHLFQKMQFSSVYHKYMFPVSNEILNMVLSFVKEKTDGRPLEMALDVGCGTGRYTLPLAPHFKKVMGIDVSQSQINMAKQNTLLDNVSFMVASAEKLPMEKDSVDLVTSALAAHWFKADTFASEAVRVLKTKGCIAVHAFYPYTDIEYKDLSHELTEVMSEVWETFSQYYDYSIKSMRCQYRNIYEAIPLKDKKWITGIPITFHISIPELIGFIQAAYPYQVLKEKDEKKAKQLLIQTEKRFRNILRENTDSVQLNIHMKYYCVLACKR